MVDSQKLRKGEHILVFYSSDVTFVCKQSDVGQYFVTLHLTEAHAGEISM